MALKASPYSRDAGTGFDTDHPAQVVNFRPRLILVIEYGATVPPRWNDVERSEVDYAGAYPEGSRCNNCGAAECDHIWQVMNPGDRYWVVDCNREPRLT